MRICFFGIYDPLYSRNRILRRAFELAGHEVIDCRTEKQGIGKYSDLIRKHARLRGAYDCMFVAFPGQQAVILARLITSKKIIFDPFVSLHMTLVDDRRKYARFSIRALYYFLLDYLSCRCANVYIFDTFAQRDYFIERFGCDAKKSHRILVGSDPALFYPDTSTQHRAPFTVHFHGTHIPLQGVPTVLEAGKTLAEKGIRVSIVGSSIKSVYEQQYPMIIFHADVPYEHLREHIVASDVVIGIVGTTKKASLVIPNKVYEAWACGRPVVTARTPALQELAVDTVHALFCEAGNPDDLARAVLAVRDDTALRERMGQKGYELFTAYATPEKIALELESVIARVVL